MKKLEQSLYLVLCLLMGIGTLSGCVEEFEADIPTDDSDLLVVEGTISAGQMNTFYLSRTQDLRSYVPKMVSGARVSVQGSDGSLFMAQNSDANGSYSCWIDNLSPDVTYWLHIELDGEVYESEPQKPLPTEKITEVRGVQNTPESNIDVLVTTDVPFESDHVNYYSWRYDETWEVRAECSTIMYYDVEQRARVYLATLFPVRGWLDATGTTIMVGASSNYEGQRIQGLKLYDINRSDSRMYHRYSGQIYQRAISKAEYEYELARRQAGSEMGGLFTPQPSALPTNIHCITSSKHVIGFVGCSLNTSKYRFFLDAANFSIKRPPYFDSRMWIDNPSEDDCIELVNRGYYLCEWEDHTSTPGGALETAWATWSQLDVRSQGAYIEVPEFWLQGGNESYEDEE